MSVVLPVGIIHDYVNLFLTNSNSKRERMKLRTNSKNIPFNFIKNKCIDLRNEVRIWNLT